MVQPSQLVGRASERCGVCWMCVCMNEIVFLCALMVCGAGAGAGGGREDDGKGVAGVQRNITQRTAIDDLHLAAPPSVFSLGDGVGHDNAVDARRLKLLWSVPGENACLMRV